MTRGTRRLKPLSCRRYLFVGRVSAEQLRRSRAEAFQRATAQAAAVAKIGGRRLGALDTLSVSTQGFGGGDAYDPFGSVPGMPLLPPEGRSVSPSLPDEVDWDVAAPAESVSPDPSSLQYRIAVSAVFRLQQTVRSPAANP